MKAKKVLFIILFHLLIVGVIIAYFLLLNFLHISCPFRAVTGIPCPGCGMTRSAISILTLDIEGFLHYNPMVVLLLPALFAAFHYRTFLFKKVPVRIFEGYIVVSAALIILFYIIRLLFFKIP